ncbi:MAG: PLP-dependent cysteine synthase family protein [Terracidiphilus sp.]|jgi:cysteine synthase A
MNCTSPDEERLTSVQPKLAHLARLIGNTHLLAIDFRFRGQDRVLYAKCEQWNLTGSIKDRMAFHILKTAYLEGAIQPTDAIVEATSGNTGISFSALGHALGHRVKIFMPDWMSLERTRIMESYGATVIPVSHEQGGFLGSIQMTEELALAGGLFLPRQFSNRANVEAHEQTTGPEIWMQLEEAGLRPDAFVAGVGTGGTVMGVGNYLRSRNPSIRVFPVEPAESPTLSTGCKVGSHRIQGISDEFIPAIIDFRSLEAPVRVSDGDSILMAQNLAACLGLGVGISSGCNFLAALKVQQDLGPDAVVVTVFADDNKKYLSTGLLQQEPIRKNFLSPQIDLTGIRVFPAARLVTAMA